MWILIFIVLSYSCYLREHYILIIVSCVYNMTSEMKRYAHSVYNLEKKPRHNHHPLQFDVIKRCDCSLIDWVMRHTGT